MRTCARALAAAALFGSVAAPAAAQTFETVGTRAAGMGGAFVAVADDASASYWNPAGFASGSIFSLVLDRTSGERVGAGADAGGSRSGWLIAIGAPAVALSYYRLRSTELSSAPGIPEAGPFFQADTLVTHHTGATVVQSLMRGVAVGATLKLVRGVVSSATGPVSVRDELLGDGSGGAAARSSRVDADLGVMAAFGPMKAGLTVRNVAEPSFKGPAGHGAVTLERQARAGVSMAPLAGWVVAADMDVIGSGRMSGPPRRFAVGAEGRVHRRAYLRGGVNAGVSGERAAAGSVGASVAATSSLLLDLSITRGSDRAIRGWGVSARVGY